MYVYVLFYTVEKKRKNNAEKEVRYVTKSQMLTHRPHSVFDPSFTLTDSVFEGHMMLLSANQCGPLMSK